eukprot:353851-Chlamydomonas_euryale.AAC.12
MPAHSERGTGLQPAGRGEAGPRPPLEARDGNRAATLPAGGRQYYERRRSLDARRGGCGRGVALWPSGHRRGHRRGLWTRVRLKTHASATLCARTCARMTTTVRIRAVRRSLCYAAQFTVRHVASGSSSSSEITVLCPCSGHDTDARFNAARGAR